jgi:choice-of-anchor B domain-containing protein
MRTVTGFPVFRGLLPAVCCVALAAAWPSAPPSARIGFASALAVGEREIFVGRPGELAAAFEAPTEPSAVHVFAPDQRGTWVDTAQVAPADGAVGDGFGLALAADGDVLVVGAPGRDGGIGAAYVFERLGGAFWGQKATLVPAGGVAGDAMGAAVAVIGNVILVGAPGRHEGTGAVFVFERDPATRRWIPRTPLSAAGPTAGDRFGAAVALSERRALVGAPGPALSPGPPFVPGPAPRGGSAHVFARSAQGEWTEETRLLVADSAAAFGSALALAVDTAFVGAPAADARRGRVHVFVHDAGAWRERAAVAPPGPAPRGMFGYAVARAGADLLVGAPGGVGPLPVTGAVHVFRATADGEWAARQRLVIDGEGRGPMQFFGFTLAARGDLAVAGAPAEAFFEGVGHVYRRAAPTGEWAAAGAVAALVPAFEAVRGGEVRCENGAAGRFRCEGVDLAAFLPVEAVGGPRGGRVNDLWGWTDPATGREYVVVGRTDGTAFLDVTDPTLPALLGELPLPAGAGVSWWRDIKVYADHAFIVADNAGPHGMQVFDLRELRRVRSPTRFAETAHYDGIASAHNIAINEETGYAYVVGAGGGGETCGGGLHMIDVREPTRPVFTGCFTQTVDGQPGSGYTHDVQCVVYRGPDARSGGREICVAANVVALVIADVTDKTNPVALARTTYPGAAVVHQGWFSEDQRYFFQNDELDEYAGGTERTRTLVWDLRDLTDPVLAAEYLGPSRSSDHNLYVQGNYMYQANYLSGLRVVDVSRPERPVEVGHFDTVPFGEDVPGFGGAWSVYPFFRSGTVVVTSQREGVFVLTPRIRRLLP